MDIQDNAVSRTFTAQDFVHYLDRMTGVSHDDDYSKGFDAAVNMIKAEFLNYKKLGRWVDSFDREEKCLTIPK